MTWTIEEILSTQLSIRRPSFHYSMFKKNWAHQYGNNAHLTTNIVLPNQIKVPVHSLEKRNLLFHTAFPRHVRARGVIFSHPEFAISRSAGNDHEIVEISLQVISCRKSRAASFHFILVLKNAIGFTGLVWESCSFPSGQNAELPYHIRWWRWCR